jgi:hypothetical protein
VAVGRILGKMRPTKGVAVSHNLLETKRHTKVIIMEAPHRFDLVTSCVNKKVAGYFQQETVRDIEKL